LLPDPASCVQFQIDMGILIYYSSIMNKQCPVNDNSYAKISILILTHNAPEYVKETLETLTLTPKIPHVLDYETIVFDNNSDSATKVLLVKMKESGYIDKLYFSEKNNLFARGNNLASKLCSSDSNYILLLNSDIQIRKETWLQKLIDEKKRGGYAVAAYGYCARPKRADGYCFLIDRYLYDQYLLDEKYAWFWGIAKLQAEMIRDGLKILAIKNHDKYLYHHGQKSGEVPAGTSGMNIDVNEVGAWFRKDKNKYIRKKDLALVYSFYQKKKTSIEREIIKTFSKYSKWE
jgi:glycosyltransferase involved in cell wall biosynthesis